MALALGVSGAAWALWWRGGDIRGWMDGTIGALRGAGPVWFFGAMAVLPSFGFPMLPFALAAGPVFSPQLGTAGVIACALVAVACNVTLSYVVAAKVLRPWTAALLTRWGYADVLARRRDFGWRWVLFVRLAPGLPFFVQSYLLGLTRAQFAPYVVISTLVPGAYIAGTIWFGDALWRAQGRDVLWSAGVVVAVGLVWSWLQQRRSRAGEIPCSAPGQSKDKRGPKPEILR